METQVTFKQYQKLQADLHKLAGNYNNLYYKYYELNKEKEQHIKDLQSEIRFLRRQLIEKGE